MNLNTVASASRRKLREGAALSLASVVFVAAVVLAVGPAALQADAYADGAPPGFSGGFGESSCDACHFEGAVNAPPGRVTLTGIPERYVPAQAYPIAITLARPGMVIGGFQFAARFEDGGGQAGTVAPGPGDEKRIKIETGKIQYANQRLDGVTLSEPGVAKWNLIWTAPAAAGAVLFHVSASAADKDEAARGDYVYTAVAASRPR